MKRTIRYALYIGILAISMHSCKQVEEETPVELTGISLDMHSLELGIGETAVLNLTLTPENAEHSNFIWNSTDENVATVSNDGSVTAIGEGKCTINVYVNSFSESCEVTVKSDKIPVESITLDKESVEMEIGQTLQLTATVLPENADDRNVTWSSSDERVATVADGKITSLSAGSTTITATAGEVSATCDVTVNSEPAKVGDFYYSDGTYSTELDQNRKPVAIVFWTGDPGAEDPALKADHPDCVKGLAVSLTEENSSWQAGYGQYNNTVGAWIETNCPDLLSTVSDINPRDNLNKKLGYNNTKGIEAFNNDASNAGWNVDAVSALMFFRLDEENKAPETSSGWYLPSAKELAVLCYGDYCGEDKSIWDISDAPLDNINKVNESLKKISGASAIESMYWSSTELNSFSSFCMVASNGNTAYDNKSSRSLKLRFILAF